MSRQGDGGLRSIRCDGSPARVAELVEAVDEALDGGRAVLPVGRAAAAVVAVPSARVADDTAVVTATSGSSGEPRLVELPAAALRASAHATGLRLGGPAHWLLALPAEHVAGVQVIVRALLAGDAPGVQDLRDGFRPDGFAAATAALPSGRRHTSLVPTQLLRLLDAGDEPLAALRSYDAVLVGGAALDPALRVRAEDAGVRVVETYGLTETCGGCVYDGVPLDGARIELVGDTSHERHVREDLRPERAVRAVDPVSGGPEVVGGGPDGVGRIVVAGPMMACGYLGRPAETAEAFAYGRFHTADLGRRSADGRLEVLGRADDVIVTGGRKVAAAAVERTLAAQPGVRAACVVGLPDPEWGQVVAAAVVLDPAGSTAPTHDRLRAAVRAALGRSAVPRRLLDLPELPELPGIGKPDRAAVTRRFTADDPAG